MASLRRSMVISVLFSIFGGPGMVLVYLPYWITRFRIPAGQSLWRILIAGALILVGSTLLLDSIRRFIYQGRGTLMPAVPTEHLVVTGLYRYVRNPMYVGVLTVLIGETVLLYSTAMVEYAATVMLGFELFVRLYEEPTLRRRYGAEYLRYCQQVHRWWPRLTPLQ